MKHNIIFSVSRLVLISIFTIYLYIGLANLVSSQKHFKINMTGAIGVLESIYVHNAFQCIIGVAPVAILVKENSGTYDFSLLPLINTAYGKSYYGNPLRNSSVVSVTPFIYQPDHSSS